MTNSAVFSICSAVFKNSTVIRTHANALREYITLYTTNTMGKIQNDV